MNALVNAGYSPLTSMVLSSRGIGDKQEAYNYLSCDAPLPDPFLMTDMAPAARRVEQGAREQSLERPAVAVALVVNEFARARRQLKAGSRAGA